jgi:hypothetical protein
LILNTPERLGLFIQKRAISDLARMGARRGGSGRWGDRPLLGIGGDGGAATRGTRPESTVILPVVGGTVDRQLDSIESVPSYFFPDFDVCSPESVGRLSPAHLYDFCNRRPREGLKPLLIVKIDFVVIATAFWLECGPCQPSHLRCPIARVRSQPFKSSR